MSDANDFADLLRRVRGGDDEAATELFNRYESAIRREARLRIGPDLRPILESTEISQSVFKTFFFRVAAGQFDIESPKQLIGLLKMITLRKVAQKARRPRVEALSEREPIDPTPGPLTKIAIKDFVNKIRSSIDQGDLRMIDLRLDDLTWDEISKLIGGRPNTLARRYSRLLDDIYRRHRIRGVEY